MNLHEAMRKIKEPEVREKIIEAVRKLPDHPNKNYILSRMEKKRMCGPCFRTGIYFLAESKVTEI
jgi:hypothetical protein